MSGYIAGTDYVAYLQARSSVDHIQWDISPTNLNLVASREAIEQQGFRIEQSLPLRLQQADGTLAEGSVTLHFDALPVESLIGELSAKFDWGLDRLEAATGSLQAPVEKLVRLARTPKPTWAYEQFDVGREAFRRDLFPEAIEYIERAINGYQTHPGHRQEYRFHLLLGIVRRGSYRNHSPEIIDLEEAKQAYLSASRYAASDHKHDAARALCAAGWTSYCQDRLDEALEYTSRAMTFADLAEAHFQRSKILLHRGEVDAGLGSLVKAINADPLYAVRCFDDGDFLAHEEAVRDSIIDLRDERLKACREAFTAAEGAISLAETEIASVNKLRPQLEKRLSGRAARTFKRSYEEMSGVAVEMQGARRLSHRNAALPEGVPFIDVTNAMRVTRPIIDPIGKLLRIIEGQGEKLYDLVESEVNDKYQKTYAAVFGKGPFPVGAVIWPLYGLTVIVSAFIVESTRSSGAILFFSIALIGGAMMAAVAQVGLGQAAAQAHEKKATRLAKEASEALRSELLSLYRQLTGAKESIEARLGRLRSLFEKKH